jgi:hypothetical protein
LLTVSKRPPERISVIERAIEGFSATQRTRIAGRRDGRMRKGTTRESNMRKQGHDIYNKYKLLRRLPGPLCFLLLCFFHHDHAEETTDGRESNE